MSETQNPSSRTTTAPKHPCHARLTAPSRPAQTNRSFINQIANVMLGLMFGLMFGLMLEPALHATALATPPERGTDPDSTVSANPATLIYDTGGALTPEQAAYDVTYYHLDVRIDPEQRSINGKLGMQARLLQNTPHIEMALDPGLTIHSIQAESQNHPCTFQRTPHSKRILIATDCFTSDAANTIPSANSTQPSNTQTANTQTTNSTQPSNTQTANTQTTSNTQSSNTQSTNTQPANTNTNTISLQIDYEGTPREAPFAPWDGGVVWDSTSAGDPWIGVATQMNGAWLWWPNKDHNADRPDSMAISLTLPENLTAVSNGILRSLNTTDDGWKQWNWFTSYPISTYNVTFNAAPYETITSTYKSTAGTNIPVTFWVLPEKLEEGRRLFPQFTEQLRFFEDLLGPYPFLREKYGVAHAPYLGMEHQSIIAYGASFQNDNLFGVQVGYDDLHHHELAHEWWGNMVYAADWKDFWIHEGFGTYMQALYAEHKQGKEGYRLFMDHLKTTIQSDAPMVPRHPASMLDISGGGRGGDVYFKGAWVLHTLRFVVGDKNFFRILQEFLYPDPALLEGLMTGNDHIRPVDSEAFQQTAEQVLGDDLQWFFETYLHQTKIPVMSVTRLNGVLSIRWVVEDNQPFPMPLEISLDGENIILVPENNRITMEVDDQVEVILDPEDKILKEFQLRQL